MEKFAMCRICLVKNVRMCVVVDINMQELYGKLTCIPFVTDDSRPMCACFFCFAKLKQCYQLQRQCLEAEQLFTQMMNEPNPVMDRGQIELFNGFMKTPIENINIIDVGQLESIAVKDEFPADGTRLADVIQLKEDLQSNDLELENKDNIHLDVEYTPQHHSESDLDDVPVMELKTEVKEEQTVSRKKCRVSDTGSSQNTSGARTVTRKYLFDRMQNFDLHNLEEKLTLLNEELLPCEGYSEDQIKSFKRTFSHFKSQLRQRWSHAQRNEDRFRKYNDSWLEGKIEMPVVAQNLENLKG